MKKLFLTFISLLFLTGTTVISINAAEDIKSKASYTRTCTLPINDNYNSNGVNFQDSAVLVLTIRVNDATGIITSYDAYLSVNWVAVTSPYVNYTGTLNTINVSKSLSSTGRTAYATASYTILGETFLGVDNVSYYVAGHTLSCS